MGSHTGSTRITGKRCLHCGELMITPAMRKAYSEEQARVITEQNRQLDAVREVVRETRDDFAPDHPPYDVTDLLDRVEKAMERE